MFDTLIEFNASIIYGCVEKLTAFLLRFSKIKTKREYTISAVALMKWQKIKASKKQTTRTDTNKKEQLKMVIKLIEKIVKSIKICLKRRYSGAGLKKQILYDGINKRLQ